MHLVKSGKLESTKNDNEVKQIIDELIDKSGCKNTDRSYKSDLKIFWSWAKLRHKVEPHYPVHKDLLLSFVARHSALPDQHIDLEMVKMGIRKKTGPYKISTLRRFIYTLSREHTRRDVENTTKYPKIHLLLRNLGKNIPELKKSRKKALTVDLIHKMCSTCNDKLVDMRDKALLMTMFASGGRRRSEIVNLQIDDVENKNDGFILTFKNTKNGDDLTVPIEGKAANSLTEWLHSSKISEGAVFRSLIGNKKIGAKLNDRWVHQIVKTRLKKAGINPEGYSSHSIRSGFVTSCAEAGITLAQTTSLSAHKTHQIALDYYRPGDLVLNPATIIME